MIKVFSRLRKSLLMEGKTSRYFKYAIGEIALVVIGILIALQVNNWNQNRNSNNEAHKALSSLRDDFQANLSYIEETAYRVNRMGDCTDKLIKTIDRDSTSIHPDSLGIYLTSGACSWWRVKTVSNTYDALSGAGNINLIRNDTLRKLLAEFYSTTQSGFEDEDNLEQLALKILELTSNETYILWSNYRFEEYVKVTEKGDALKQAAVNSILDKKDVMGLLIYKNVLEVNQKYYLDNLLSLSGNILTEIDKELEL